MIAGKSRPILPITMYKMIPKFKAKHFLHTSKPNKYLSDGMLKEFMDANKHEFKMNSEKN